MNNQEDQSSWIMNIASAPLSNLEYHHGVIEYVTEETMAWYEDQQDINNPDLERLESTTRNSGEVLDKAGIELRRLRKLLATISAEEIDMATKDHFNQVLNITNTKLNQLSRAQKKIIRSFKTK